MVDLPVGALAAVEVAGLTVSFPGKVALRDLSFSVAAHEIFGIVGPAQSGKSTLLRLLNGTIESAHVSGIVRVHGQDVRSFRPLHELRRRVGMVMPLPVGLPLSVFENVAFAPRLAGIRSRSELAGRVEHCLRHAALWDEVKDRLDELGTRLSGGQQQRLTIARALSHEPQVLCLDEFSIAIDPVTTMRIEDVLRELRRRMTIILVTNLTAQARRLTDRTLFLLNGDPVELGTTTQLFADPRHDLTRRYLRGDFG